MVLPPTVLGFYLLIVLGPSGPGGWIASLWGARTLAFTFTGLVIASILSSMPFVVQPIRNAFAALGDRPLEVAGDLARFADARLLDRRAAAREPRPAHRRGARLCPYGRRVRRHPDDRRQHSRPHPRHVDRDLRLRRDDAMARGEHSRRRHGRLRLRGDPLDDAARKALRARPAHERARTAIRAAVQGNPRQVHARRRLHRAGGGRDRPVRPVGLRQDRGAALHRGPAALPGRRLARSTATSGKIAKACSCRRIGARSAMSSRKRACFRTFRCGKICCSARRATATAKARDRL